MSKRRKKSKDCFPASQKSSQRQSFFKKVIEVLDVFGCPDVISLMTKEERDHFYTLRFKPLKVVSAEGNIKACTIKEFGQIIKSFQHGDTIPVESTGKSISRYDFETIATYIYCFFYAEKSKSISRAFRLRPMLEPLFNFIGDTENQLADNSDSLTALFESSFFNGVYYTSRSHTGDHGYRSYQCVKLYKVNLEAKHIVIDGFSRQCYRVGWVKNKKLEYVSLKASACNGICPGNKDEYPVYIQKHAVLRLHERIDFDTMGYKEFEVFCMFSDELNISYSDGKSLYVDYHYFGQKIGYLVGEFIQGVFLIKTFLLLTQSSTPEGEKLKELTGMQMLDIKFLRMDRLSTFHHCGIKEQPEVYKLFCEAGCGDMLGLHEKDLKKSDLKVKLVDKILGYLNDTRKEYETVEELERDMKSQSLNIAV